jgi:CRP-like cAMP-binding protein
MAEKHWYIKKCDLFLLLTSDQLARLESRSRIRAFTKGNLIYLPTDAANGVLLLAEGRVKLCGYTPDGKQSTLAFIEPGELFGELAILEAGGRREEFAEATVASSVVLIPSDEIERLMRESPSLALGVTKLIGLRRQRIERRLRYLLFRSNRDRLIHLLLELTKQYGRTTVGGVELAIKLSHQDLASIIGSTRETVTVLLGELQSEGLLRIKRQHIEIRDARRLARLADEGATAGSFEPPPSDAARFAQRPAFERES